MNDPSPGPTAGLASRPLSRFLVISVLAGLLAGLGFVFIRHLIDFPVYYAAGRSLISGRTDLYAPDFASGPTMDYRYLPFFLFSLIPIWRLPYGIAAYLWYLLGLTAMSACWWATRGALWQSWPLDVNGQSHCEPAQRQVSSSDGWRRNAAGALACLGVAQYYVMALHYGNAQLLVTGLLLSAIVLASRRWNLAPGALLALAITAKITPALFLGYFALKRRWMLILITVGLVAALNLAPAIYFGFSRNAALIETWYKHVLVDQEFHEVNGPINLSLKGQLVRSLTVVDYSRRLDGDTEYPAVNVADCSYREVVRLWLILDAILLTMGIGVVVWPTMVHRVMGPFSRKCGTLPERGLGGDSSGTFAGARPVHGGGNSLTAANAPTPSTAIEIGIMLCLMLLAEPLTSKIYFVALIWPLACLLDRVLRAPRETPRAVRWGSSVIVITNFVLPLLPGRAVQRFLLVIGVDFYLTCLILVMLVLMLTGGRRAVRN